MGETWRTPPTSLCPGSWRSNGPWDVVANNIAQQQHARFFRRRARTLQRLASASAWEERWPVANRRSPSRRTAPHGAIKTPGAITHTGNPLDLAIGSQGFFSVSTPSGVRPTDTVGTFSRFRTTERSVDSSGHALLDDDGSPIILSGGGEVSVAGGWHDQHGDRSCRQGGHRRRQPTRTD